MERKKAIDKLKLYAYLLGGMMLDKNVLTKYEDQFLGGGCYICD